VLNKSRIRLNAKKLYQADGYAVQEMMKVANLLKEAVTMKKDDEVDYAHLQALVAQRNMQDAKKARQLSDFDMLGTRTFDITPDGTRIVFDRLRENSDIVLVDLPDPDRR
jgi:clusterin-associated protein 1